MSKEFVTGDIVLVIKQDTTDSDIDKQVECVIISGPVGAAHFYKVGFEGGKTDYYAERDLSIKPQQADRLTPVKWTDCAWMPEILR